MNTEEFESLSPEEQEKIFHQTSFKEKGDLLMHSHQPQHLVRSLSQEELYLTAKEMDIGERSEILRYASLPQMFFIADIDCWKGDRIEPRAFVRWLESLNGANPKCLLTWLIEMDYETVTAGLKKLISVLKPHHEYAADELLGDTPYFTLDDSYFICVEEDNLSTVKNAFQILFENHRGKYVAILEGVMSDLDDELEEEAYQRREMRLEERGFPAAERAYRIYRPLKEKELEEYSRKDIETESQSKVDAVHTGRAPQYPVIKSSERLFLDEVLLYFRAEDPHIADGIQEELAWLSNKVIACEGIDFSSEDRVRGGIERARWFVSIGLEILSKRETRVAAEYMKKIWLEAIFRVTVTELIAVQVCAKGLIRDYWNKDNVAFFEFMNPPYEHIFRGLLQRVPQCYDAAEPAKGSHLRDCRHLDDLKKTKAAVDQMILMYRILKQKFKCKFDGGTLYSMAGTAFAWDVLGEQGSLKLMKEPDVRRFMQEAFDVREKSRGLKSGVKEAFIQRYFTEVEYAALKSMLGIVFDEIDDEFARLNPENKIDLNLIQTLYHTPAKRKVSVS